MKNIPVKEINTVSKFLALRHIKNLSVEELNAQYGIKKVDIIIVLGSDLPYIVEIACKAYHDNLGKYLMFCGGIGHSTQNLKQKVSKILYKDYTELPETEAELYALLAKEKFFVSEQNIIIEKESTNTSENIMFAMEIIKNQDILCNSVILIQDPILQYRSYITSKLFIPETSTIISYAPLIPQLNESEDIYPRLLYLWSEERFYELLLGEIWRLRDDENGYGPCGKGYIEHVDIPEEVEDSYKKIKSFLLTMEAIVKVKKTDRVCRISNRLK